MARRRDRTRSAGARGEQLAAGRAGGARHSAGGEGPHVPKWLPWALFLGLTALLFRAFIFSDAMLFGGDTLGLGYVSRASYAAMLRTYPGFPLWQPLFLGGTPLLEALSAGDSLHPVSLLLLLVMEPYRALGWKLVLHVCAGGFFMFGWVRSLGASRAAALLSGTAYLLAPYFVSLVHPGHDGKLFVTALTPLLFWAVERHFVRPDIKTFSAVALVVALVILTTHFQMAYFLFGAAGLYAMTRAIQVARSGGGGDADEADGASPGTGPRAAALRFGLFLAAAVSGAGASAVQLLPAIDYVTEHSRRVQTTRDAAGESGAAWSSSWSLHPEEAMSLVIPEFAGNNAGGAPWAEGTYWGRNVTRDNHPSSGLVVLLLSVVAFAGGRRRVVRWFFAGLGGVALLFALGAHTPVWRVFYEVVPGIRLFRAPDQVMFLFVFGAATVAALGLDRLLRITEDDTGRGGGLAGAPAPLKALLASVAALGVLALLAQTGVLTSLWTSIVYTDPAPGRLERLATLQPFIARGAWISFLLAAATAAAAWAFRERYLAPAGLAVVLVLLVVADEFRISNSFVQTLDFRQWSAADPNIRAVLERESGSDEPYRLLSFSQRGQDVRPALHGIELAGGHHPNDLSRYRELIGMVGSGDPVNLYDDDIRRLLNVRYILWPDLETGRSVGGDVLSRTQLQDGRPYETVLVEDGLPRARLVGAYTIQPDDRAVGYMLTEGFDPVREVVLSETPPIELDGGIPSGSVTWVERTPNRLELSVTTERPALLVVADNWFPAWHATVDGVEAPVLRAYHSLRAVPVPAGSHTVEMVYRSAILTRSLWVSVLVLAGLLGATAFAFVRERSAPASGSEARSAGGG